MGRSLLNSITEYYFSNHTQTKILESGLRFISLLSLFFFFFWKSFRSSSFSPSPYKHATTCSRRTLATHIRHTHSPAHLLISTKKLLELEWHKTTFYCVPKKNCPLTFWGPDRVVGSLVVEGFLMMGIITTAPAYLTASYLNFAKLIGFTVQMYMCTGALFCCPRTRCPRLCWNVSRWPFCFVFFFFFYWELPLCFAWLACFSHLVSTASITFQSECYVLAGGVSCFKCVSLEIWTGLKVLWDYVLHDNLCSCRTYVAQAQNSSNPGLRL